MQAKKVGFTFALLRRTLYKKANKNTLLHALGLLFNYTTAYFVIVLLMKRTLLLLLSLFFSLSLSFAQNSALSHYTNAEHKANRGEYADALPLYAKAVAAEPENHNYLYAKAQCEARLEKKEDAVRTLKATLEANSTFAPAYALLGKLLDRNGEKTRAAAFFELAYKHETAARKQAAYGLYAMRQFLAEKNYNKAVRLGADIGTKFPQHFDLRLLEAQALNGLKQYEAAEKALTATAQKLNLQTPAEKAAYHYELGYAQYHLKKYSEAFKTWKNAEYGIYKKKVVRYSPAYQSDLAEAYADLHDYARAAQHLDVLREVAPQHATIFYVEAEMALKKCGFEEAIASFRQAARQEKDPRQSLLTYQKVSELLVFNDRFAEALETAENGLSLNENHGLLRKIKALCLYKLARYDEATVLLEELTPTLRSAQEQGRAWFLLGRCYAMTGQKSEALRALSQVNVAPYRVAALDLMEELRQGKSIAVLVSAR